jgi:CRISPR-associated protein Cas1
VRAAFDDALLEEASRTVADAWNTARSGVVPAPLTDSPKCPGCSLLPICLPDETNALRSTAQVRESVQLELFANQESISRTPPAHEIRRLVTPRSELRPVYIDTQGLRIGKSGEVLQVKDKETVRHEIRIGEICQLNLMGNIQITTQAVQSLCESGVPVCYFSQGGWFYGITAGMNTKNVFLRKSQFGLAEQEWFCLKLSRKLVAGKVRNQRTMLQRNHVEPNALVLAEMKTMVERAEAAASLDELLGIEGNAARLYFQAFAGMLKAEQDEKTPAMFRMDFSGRNRRPPRDAVNALLSLGYSILAKDLTVTCYAVGLDPLIGFYHQPRFGRPALALDLMEPFRPLIVDSSVINAINLHNHGVVVNEVFWGLWLFPFGLLVYRSRFLPRLLGVWLILNGCAYVALSVTSLMWPQYQARVWNAAFPVMFGELAIMLWLIVFGAKERQPVAATA